MYHVIKKKKKNLRKGYLPTFLVKKKKNLSPVLSKKKPTSANFFCFFSNLWIIARLKTLQ